MNDELIPIGLDEYKEILQRAVAVIDGTRVTIARQVTNSVTLFYSTSSTFSIRQIFAMTVSNSTKE